MFYLTTELAQMGLNIHVVLDDEAKEDYSMEGVQVNSFSIPKNPISAYRSTLNKLSKLYDKYRYDILVDFEHAIKWNKASCAKAVTRISKSKRVQLVYYFGNHYPWLVFNSEPESNPWILWRILRELLNESDKVVAASSILARAAIQKMGWHDHRIEIVPFGVRLSEYADKDTYTSDNAGNVLFVGRVVKHKGLDELLEAAYIIKKRGYDFIFTIVGPRGEDWDDAPSRYYNELEAKVKELGLGNKFRFTGSLTKEEVILKMSKSNIFCFPSHIEGFGMALVQAMAAQLIPVIYDSEPMSEIAGSAAIKAKPFDSLSLAESILTANSNKNTRTLVSERIQRYSIDRVAREFLSRIEA